MSEKDLVDIVNEHDEVVGATTREEAHTKGIAHRIAAVFVFTDDGKLLVQHRKKDGLLDHSAAGHVDVGETYDGAARRELKEELGLESKTEKIGIIHADERLPTRAMQTIHYFCLYETMPGNDTLKRMVLSKEEVEEMIPMRLEEIAQAMKVEPRKFTTGFQYTLNFYIDKKTLAIEKVKIQ